MYETQLAERYVRALVNEITARSEVNDPTPVDTIYFGGGTPSLLSPKQLGDILDAARRRFVVSPHCEVTMEMNPGTVTAEILYRFKELGVNRASFGAQTFDEVELARLGRSHTSTHTRETFQQLRQAGFDNVSFDLIAGLPGQTLEGWRLNLEQSFELKPEHLSFYLLEVHEGTPLANHIRTGLQPKPDDDLAVEMYELMLDSAAGAGYEHYEISNLCLPGFESRHNSKYWIGAPCYGFGCSAHSFDGGFRRWANERDVGTYVKQVELENSPVVERIELSVADMKAEAVFLGMRLMNGIDTAQYEKSFGTNLRAEHKEDLQRFGEAGLIEIDGNLLKLTRTGALLSNEVFSAFV